MELKCDEELSEENQWEDRDTTMAWLNCHEPDLWKGVKELERIVYQTIDNSQSDDGRYLEKIWLFLVTNAIAREEEHTETDWEVVG